MCSTSSRVPWKALFAVTVPSTSQIGCRPRSRAASADSTTRAAAPIPRIIPCRRWSNGMAASSTTSSVAAAPEARNPDPSHGSSASEVASSADTTTTRRQRPARIQSSASATACVVLAHAALTCVFGPRAPMISANCECPIDRHRNRKRRSNAYGSVSRVWRSSWMRRSTSAAAGSSSLIRARTASSALSCSRSAAVDVVALELIGEVVQAGEGGGEDDAGVVAHRLRQPPPVGQLGAQCRGLVVQHQRDAGVAQRVEAGADRQPGRRVQRRVAVGVDAELADHIERCAAAGQLDDLGFVVDRLERGVAGRALDQAGDVLVEHLAAQPVRDRVDELLAVEDAGDVLVVEDPLGPGQAERRAGDHHRLGGGRRRRPAP